MRYRHTLILALAMCVTLVYPSGASATLATHLAISELQAGTSSSASQEFIELYNPTDADVALTGWELGYKSAASTDTTSSWSKHVALTGSIKSHGFYLIGPRSYIPTSDSDWSATLASTGGAVRLRDAQGAVVDQLAYGSGALGAEGGAAALAPPTGQSIERLMGRLNESGGNGIDTNVNGADFVVREQPLPQDTRAEIETPSEEAMPIEVPPVVDVVDDASAPSLIYETAYITELLPDPVAPLTDSHDEFIELFNPSDHPIDLQGYTLRTGTNFRSYYLLPVTIIPAGGYVALYAYQTKLGLTNSGGAVQLLDPVGAVIDQTDGYGAAPAGQAWGLFDDGWHWTLQLTPGAQNQLVSLVAGAATVKPKAVAKAKAATKPKTAAKPKAPAKPKVPKSAKLKKASAQVRALAERGLQPARWLIIALAILTIGYATYEFRHDIINYYHRLRGHTGRGAADRPEPEGGRGD